VSPACSCSAPRPASGRRRHGRTVAGELVPGPGEPRQGLGLHLQQITGARPLKPADLLARRPGRPGHAAPRQTAADGRVRHPELARDQPGSPTGALPRLADPIVHGVADASGLPVRRRRLVVRPRAAGALGFRRSAIARDPVLDRGDTDTTPARRFAARHPPSRQRPTNSTRCHAGSHLRLHCLRADDLRRPWISRRTHSFCLSPDALIPSYPAFGSPGRACRGCLGSPTWRRRRASPLGGAPLVAPTLASPANRAAATPAPVRMPEACRWAG
jgi:hypothetical protein